MRRLLNIFIYRLTIIYRAIEPGSACDFGYAGEFPVSQKMNEERL